MTPADRFRDGVAAGPAGQLPAGAGIGLRHCHIDAVLLERPSIPWLELLADNHFANGGPTLVQVDAVARHYPLTLHCVGMNLAGTDPLDPDYLRRVDDLRRRSAAAWVSDHLCFTAIDGRHYHELLPFPYTESTLCHVAARIQRVQERLGMPLVVENVSSYLRFRDSALTETEFLAELSARTDCGLLLDVNNLYVNQANHGDDLDAALAALPPARVQELHLAGFAQRDGWLLDAHGAPVAEPVWALYERVLRWLAAASVGPVPTLIEWDNDIPELGVLRGEAARADAVAAQASAVTAAVL